jgi:hypothetical protein
MSTRLKRLTLIAPFAIAAMALFCVLGGEIVKALWNWLMPGLFGLPALTFWQALGVLALSRILFGGHGFAGSRGRSRTPEERDRFRQAFRKRFGLSETVGQ